MPGISENDTPIYSPLPRYLFPEYTSCWCYLSSKAVLFLFVYLSRGFRHRPCSALGVLELGEGRAPLAICVGHPTSTSSIMLGSQSSPSGQDKLDLLNFPWPLLLLGQTHPRCCFEMYRGNEQRQGQHRATLTTSHHTTPRTTQAVHDTLSLATQNQTHLYLIPIHTMLRALGSDCLAYAQRFTASFLHGKRGTAAGAGTVLVMPSTLTPPYAAYPEAIPSK